MKIIRINEQNIESITAAIEAVEGKATARKITAQDIIAACNSVTARLGISKSAMNGVKIHCDLHAQRFPRAYKYTPESTQFTAEYKSGEWRLISVERCECHNRDTINATVEHTEASRTAIMTRMSGLWV